MPLKQTFAVNNVTHLSFHFGPALLLFLAFPYVLVFLLSLRERLQELVKDAKELIWLHLAGILPKVLHCPQELQDQSEEEHRERHRGLDLLRQSAEARLPLSVTGLQATR